MGPETRWNFGIKPRDAAGGVGALPCLGTGLCGGLGSVGFTVGPEELRGLFQQESFLDCVGKSLPFGFPLLAVPQGTLETPG